VRARADTVSISSIGALAGAAERLPGNFRIHEAKGLIPLRNAHFRLFAGAVLISFSPVFVRLVTVSPTASGFYRAFIGGIALTAYLALFRRRRPEGTAVVPLVCAGVFFALDLWFWHRSIVLIGPGLSTLLANLQVFFMIAAGFVLFRERPTAVQLVAAPLAILGLMLIFGGDRLGVEAGFRLGVVLGLLTAMSYAGYLLSMRRARRDAIDPLPAAEVAAVSLFVAMLLGAASVVEGGSLAIPSPADFGWLLAYGLLAHALGLMLIASSLNRVPAAEVGIALLLQPALSLLWDRLFFGRVLSLVESVGVVVTLLAIALGSARRVR
jgi:drug/metabolite transporter (DMT)-like permease